MTPFHQYLVYALLLLSLEAKMVQIQTMYPLVPSCQRHHLQPELQPPAAATLQPTIRPSEPKDQ